jgi:hypothetical protein
MKPFSLSALLAFAALGIAALGSAASAATTTTVSSTTTRAQLHTTNNVSRYSKTTMNNLSRYSRAECAKHKGVMIKQKSNGKLVCVAKMR